MKKIIILAAVVILGSILRLYQLNSFPEGIHIDEASRGYNAYSILKTGKDEYGTSFPIFFQAEGEYKLPIGVYASSLFYNFFGLSKYSDRLFSVFLAIAAIIVVYGVFYEIRQNNKLSLLGTFLYSASHWFWSFSRNSDVAHQIVITSTLLSIFFLIKFIKNKNNIKLVTSFVFALIAMFSYRSATLVLPLFFLIVFFIYFKKFEFSKKLLYLFLLALMFFLLFFSLNAVMKRFESSGTNSSPEMVSLQGEQLREDGVSANTYVSRFMHNKAMNWFRLIGKKYWENLDPSFLFWKGDESLNNSIANEPNFLYFEVVFFGCGMFFLNRKMKIVEIDNLLVLLIFLSPIPSSLVMDSRNGARLLIAGFAFTHIIAYGIFSLLNVVKQTKIRILFACAIIGAYFYFSSFMIHEFYIHKTIHQPWYRNYSLEDLVTEINKKKNEYKNVVFETNFVTLYMFISKFNPIELQEKIKNMSNYNFKTKNMSIISPNFSIGTCGFGNFGVIEVLYVCSGNRIPMKSKIIKVFRYGDGQISYILLEFDPNAKLGVKLPVGVELR